MLHQIDIEIAKGTHRSRRAAEQHVLQRVNLDRHDDDQLNDETFASILKRRHNPQKIAKQVRRLKPISNHVEFQRMLASAARIISDRQSVIYAHEPSFFSDASIEKMEAPDT